MVAAEYAAVKTEEDFSDDGNASRPLHRPKYHALLVPSLCFLLLVSLAFNGLSYSKLLLSTIATGKNVTRVAGLSWDTPMVMEVDSPFNSPNRTIEDEAWASSLVNPMNLIVAVNDSMTESLGVLPAMRWPWDSHKGVYTLTAGHELHCLHLLRTIVNEAYEGDELSWHRHHVVHCLEYLLQNVMCHADDTLLYQGRLNQNEHAPETMVGLGDTRMCRSWDQLQAWGKDNNACWDQWYKKDDPTVSETDRFKFCPNGDKPWETVQGRSA